jgi:hypothetical protein
LQHVGKRRVNVAGRDTVHGDRLRAPLLRSPRQRRRPPQQAIAPSPVPARATRESVHSVDASPGRFDDRAPPGRSRFRHRCGSAIRRRERAGGGRKGGRGRRLAAPASPEPGQTQQAQACQRHGARLGLSRDMISCALRGRLVLRTPLVHGLLSSLPRRGEAPLGRTPFALARGSRGQPPPVRARAAGSCGP